MQEKFKEISPQKTPKNSLQTSEKSEKPHKPLQALTFPLSENQIFRKFSDIFRSDFAKIYQNFRQTNSSQRQLTQASVWRKFNMEAGFDWLEKKSKKVLDISISINFWFAVKKLHQIKNENKL